jgi:hypothetical protein
MILLQHNMLFSSVSKKKIIVYNSAVKTDKRAVYLGDISGRFKEGN